MVKPRPEDSPRLPPRDSPRESYVAVGRIIGSWGVSGYVKVDPLTDFPDRFAVGTELYVQGVRRKVRACHWQRGRPHILLSGIDTAAAADKLQGMLLEVPERDLHPLEEDQYYRFQLVNLTVRTAKGEVLGQVAAVLDNPANDVLVVRDSAGQEILLPFVGDVIRNVDLDGGWIEVEPFDETV